MVLPLRTALSGILFPERRRPGLDRPQQPIRAVVRAFQLAQKPQRLEPVEKPDLHPAALRPADLRHREKIHFPQRSGIQLVAEKQLHRVADVAECQLPEPLQRRLLLHG
ncbi:MAG: hypothetical protein ACLSD3_06995 [Acutalibacteraceae bacterium]